MASRILFLFAFTFTLHFTSVVWSADLDQAVQSSLQKNEVVGQSRSQLGQVREQVKQTQSAIYPNLSVIGTHLVQPRLDDAAAREFFPENQTTASLTLSQPLFRGFREFAAVRRQKDLLSAQELTRLSQMMNLYQQVAESYLNVLAIEQDLRNVDAQRKIYADRIRDLQGRTRRGESSATESLTAQSTAAALDADFQLLGVSLRSARENLALLTGLAVDEPLMDQSGTQGFEALRPLEQYLSRVDERPDVQIAVKRKEASEEDVSIAKGGHWPSADLLGNYYLVRPEGIQKDLKWDVQLRLTLPLYEGGLRQSQVREASLKKGESDLELAKLRRQGTAEIKSLYDSVRMRVDQLKALQTASDLAERNYQVLLRDSRRGLARSIDVQLGLTEYRVARRSYDQARYQARLERIRLDLASAQIPSVLKQELANDSF